MTAAAKRERELDALEKTSPAAKVAKNSPAAKKQQAAANSTPRSRGRKSISVISPGGVKARPDDSKLPALDPSSFKPGMPAPVVKEGDEEYMIIATGIKDTGLTGNYWSNMDELPTRRRRSGKEQPDTSADASPPPSPTPTPKPQEDTTPTPKKRGPKRKQPAQEDKVLTSDYPGFNTAIHDFFVLVSAQNRRRCPAGCQVCEEAAGLAYFGRRRRIYWGQEEEEVGRRHERGIGRHRAQ
jgi:hypothetical protein